MSCLQCHVCSQGHPVPGRASEMGLFCNGRVGPTSAPHSAGLLGSGAEGWAMGSVGDTLSPGLLGLQDRKLVAPVRVGLGLSLGMLWLDCLGLAPACTGLVVTWGVVVEIEWLEALPGPSGLGRCGRHLSGVQPALVPLPHPAHGGLAMLRGPCSQFHWEGLVKAQPAQAFPSQPPFPRGTQKPHPWGKHWLLALP